MCELESEALLIVSRSAQSVRNLLALKQESFQLLWADDVENWESWLLYYIVQDAFCIELEMPEKF